MKRYKKIHCVRILSDNNIRSVISVYSQIYPHLIRIRFLVEIKPKFSSYKATVVLSFFTYIRELSRYNVFIWN